MDTREYRREFRPSVAYLQGRSGAGPPSPPVAAPEHVLSELVGRLLLVPQHGVPADGRRVPHDLQLVVADALGHVVVLGAPAPEHVRVAVQIPEDEVEVEDEAT